jgi:flagellar biosynthetic protein FlhB
MAAETDLSRTEPASPQRLQQARSAGDVPRSAELTAWLVLLAGLGALAWLAPRLLGALQGVFEAALTHAAAPRSPALRAAVESLLWSLLPLLAILFAAALVAPALLSGWVFAPRTARIDATRVRLFQSVRRLASADAWFDGTLALLKLALVLATVYWLLADGWTRMAAAPLSRDAGPAWVGRGLLSVAAALALIAVLDAGWRWWRYLRRHAMTWQEVLAEARESEVSPEMRAQLRSRQQRAGQGANAGPRVSPHPNPLPEGEGANAGPKASPHPNPLPGGEGANAGPRAINEVIG